MNDGGWFGISQRSPPRNEPAEQGLLGALLANNTKAYEQVGGFLKPEHFADPIHGAIYAAIQRRVGAGQIADAVTLRAEFEHSGVLDEVGGPVYLGQLLAAMVSVLSAKSYGQAVLDAWLRRQLIDMGEKIVNRAFADGDAAAVLTDAAAGINAVVESAVGTTRKAATALEAVDMAIEAADAAYRGDVVAGVSVGMPAIEAALGKLENGGLYVLAGRPGSGKSSLALQWALNVAMAGSGVLFVSMEMTAGALGRRAIAILGDVPLSRMKAGEHADDIPEILQVRRRLLSIPLSIEDGGFVTAVEMLAMAQAAKRRHGLGLIVVDHLHIAKPAAEDVRNGPTAMIAGLAHAMKAMAKRMNCPVLLLAQLSRGLEGREDARPNLGDLRQAGAIEEDADAVMFVYRPELHLPKSPPERRLGETDEKHAARQSQYYSMKNGTAGKATFIIGKFRDGDPRDVQLRFDGPTATFREPEND